MLKAVAPVLLALATFATPAAATDTTECQRVFVTLPNGERGVTYCPGL